MTFQRNELLKFRRHFKLTQPDVSLIFGYSIRTVKYWEAGGRIPSCVGLAAAAWAMGLKPWGINKDVN